ncbi:MAG: hypothetical protein ACRECD_10045 [Burkholderiaceae bacterium]
MQVPDRPRVIPLQPDKASLREVRALFGEAPAGGHRRDLLIGHLYALDDAHRGLFERHLVALAAEMRLSMVEVFEVASFYHHFEGSHRPFEGSSPRRQRFGSGHR